MHMSTAAARALIVLHGGMAIQACMAAVLCGPFNNDRGPAQGMRVHRMQVYAPSVHAPIAHTSRMRSQKDWSTVSL
jgi:hypothetical protein